MFCSNLCEAARKSSAKGFIDGVMGHLPHLGFLRNWRAIDRYWAPKSNPWSYLATVYRLLGAHHAALLTVAARNANAEHKTAKSGDSEHVPPPLVDE